MSSSTSAAARALERARQIEHGTATREAPHGKRRAIDYEDEDEDDIDDTEEDSEDDIDDEDDSDDSDDAEEGDDEDDSSDEDDEPEEESKEVKKLLKRWVNDVGGLKRAAKMLRIRSPRTVSYWLAGKNLPRQKTLLRLHTLSGISIESLINIKRS